MLVLTRRIGEEIVIDGSIRVTIVSIQEGRVRLGVTAPEDVRVDRQEIHERRTQSEVANSGARGPRPLNRNRAHAPNG
jgi:carbon storage regulator